MAEKPRPVFKSAAAANHKPAGSARPRPTRAPGTDDSQFPSVGVTLRSYSRDTTQSSRSAGRAAKPAKNKRNWRRPFTLRNISLFISLIILLTVASVGGKFVYNAHKLFKGNIFNVLDTTRLKGENSGRVNILLAGNSADDVGHEGGELTDSIMILSINTKDHSAFMLSVPRDLYVDISNDNYQKINYAYVYGEQKKFNQTGFAPGGMGKLEQIIEQNLGIDINYYALVNYNAFREAVDAVGGIDVNIQSSDPRGLYDPSIDYVTRGPLVKLTNGVHHLNGEAALDLARARGDNYRAYGFAQSDFDRTMHQRQMLVALKTKAVSTGVITNPAKLVSLSDAIGNNVKTDFQIKEIRRLYDLTKDINGGNIASVSLNNANGKNLLANYQTLDGQSALAPAAGLNDYSDIQSFLRQQFSSNGVVREAASMVVLNGTSTAGLASSQRDRLVTKNFNVDAVGDAQAAQTVTSLIDVSKGQKPATLAALKKIYPKATVTTTNPYGTSYSTDIIIVLGNDAVPVASTSTSSTSGQ